MLYVIETSKAKTQCSKLNKVKPRSYHSIANNILQDKKIVVNQNTHPQPMKGLFTIKILVGCNLKRHIGP